MNLSGSQKVAILLLGIGQETAAEIMRQMDGHELKRVLQAMQLLRKVDQETVDKVFLELHELLQQPSLAQGGARSIKSLIGSAFGGKAEEISKRLGLDRSVGLPALERLNPEPLANFLRGEHPQTVALVVAHLSAAKFRDTLKQLPSDRYVDILSRVAKLEAVDPETLEQLNAALESLADQQGAAAQSLGGPAKVAALLNTLETEQGRALLENLAQRDPELVEQVKQYMFTFDDLRKLDQRNMTLLLKQVDRKELLLALKLASDQVKARIFESMSSRAVELLREDFESLGKAKRSEVEAAQKNIAEIARGLMEDGTIHILDPGEYVA